jgi:anti-sigma regulatory factor (Ser/Thr protein kinase)/biotin operon repressor
MDLKSTILALAEKKGKVSTQELAEEFKISRQYVVRLLNALVKEGQLMKVGSTRGAFYVIPKPASEVGWTIAKRLRNTNLKEHEVMQSIEKRSQFVRSLDENVRSIFEYAFSEMLNNAIEHSQSKNITVEVSKTDHDLAFRVNDFGIGVFRNVMQKRHLASELEAMQDLLKGKTTTQPQAHSGEGIFFTSKIADRFILESFGYRMTVDNIINDVFFEEIKPVTRGTRVFLQIASASKKHLSDLFREYQTDPKEPAFDKTTIRVKLYTMGTIHVSRSQARRVLAGLEKFRSIVLDFDQVPNVGQAFADEVFRVFRSKHPAIQIISTNMNEAVRFMIERVGK